MGLKQEPKPEMHKSGKAEMARLKRENAKLATQLREEQRQGQMTERPGGGGGGAKAVTVLPDREAEPVAEEKTRRSALHSQLRKTKFCVYHLQGMCQFGDNCAFAHSCVELHGAPDLRKTRLCQNFVKGLCQDPNCTFAHNEEELRSTDMFYKKTMCMWYDKGRCRNGDQCRFAHGADELRAREKNSKILAEAGEVQGGVPVPLTKAKSAAEPGVKVAAPPGPVDDLQPMKVPCVPAPNMIQRQALAEQLQNHPLPHRRQLGPLAPQEPVLEHVIENSRQLLQLKQFLAMAAARSAQFGVDGCANLGSGPDRSPTDKQQTAMALDLAQKIGRGDHGGYGAEASQGILLEKLSQNISCLSAQLSRFESQMQMRAKQPDPVQAQIGQPRRSPPQMYVPGRIYPSTPERGASRVYGTC